MKNKLIALTLVNALFLASCSQKTKQDSEVAQAASPVIFSKVLLEKWKLFITDDQVFNPTLAQILISEVAKKERPAVTEFLKNFEQDEIEQLIQDLKLNEKRVRDDLLFRNASWSNNKKFVKDTFLNSTDDLEKNIFTSSNQIKLTIAAREQKAFLQNIHSTYQSRLNVVSKEIAPVMIEAIIQSGGAKSIEMLIEKNNKETAAPRIQEILLQLKAFDDYFKHSGLTNEDQIALLASSAMAYAIYDLVKENSSVKKAAQLARWANETVRKVKEVQVLAGSLVSYTIQMEEDLTRLHSSTKKVTTDLPLLFGKIKDDFNKNLDTKKAFKYLYNKTMKGVKDKPETSSNSLVTEVIVVSESVDNMVASASGLTTNFNNILTATENLSRTLGVKLPQEFANLAVKAQKVNVAVNLAKSVIGGLSQGGIMGAVQALAGGQISSLLGGGMNFEGQAMAEFGKINKKLEQVLELQKQTIELQLKTMSMIYDLAMQMDAFHQEQMAKLDDIRDISLASLEFQRLNKDSNIRSCEMLINYELTRRIYSSPTYAAGIDPSLSSINARNFHQKLNSKEGSLLTIRRIIKSLGSNDFENCQEGINQAFGMLSINQNPVLAILETGRFKNHVTFEKNIYQPLKRYLNDKNTVELALHAPVRSFKSVPLKNKYINSILNNTQENYYELERTISTRALERYSASMLAMQPLMELDKSDWEKDLNEIFEVYALTTKAYPSRSKITLENALRMTQSAIAQESILAGEPILDHLYKDFLKYFASPDRPSDCRDRNAISDENQKCSMADNKLLLKNLFKYAVHVANYEQKDRFTQYKIAYEEKNLAALENILFQGLVRDRLSLENGIIKFNSRSSVDLPTPEEMDEGLVSYSEDMERLLKLQDQLVEALSTHGLSGLSDLKREKMAALLMTVELSKGQSSSSSLKASR